MDFADIAVRHGAEIATSLALAVGLHRLRWALSKLVVALGLIRASLRDSAAHRARVPYRRRLGGAHIGPSAKAPTIPMASKPSSSVPQHRYESRALIEPLRAQSSAMTGPEFVIVMRDGAAYPISGTSLQSVRAAILGGAQRVTIPVDLTGKVRRYQELLAADIFTMAERPKIRPEWT